MATIIDYINPLLDGQDLTREQAGRLLDTVFEGEVPEPQIAAFLTAMRIKGETASEMAGLAGSLRSHAVKVEPGIDNLVDVVGTGGAAVKTFNVSTAAALVAAGAGAYVAKHGNRAITSKCGSADVLEALGVKIDASPEVVARCIREAHVGFMFAPMFHPAMKYVQPIRKALGFRTVFNILGPLANPAGASTMVLGVANESLMPKMIEALKQLGTRRVLAVHSEGLDEISTSAPTKIIRLQDGEITTDELDPQDLGIAPADVQDMQVTDAAQSCAVVRGILQGQERGAPRDIVLLNAAAAIVAAGLADDFTSGLATAAASVDEGRALVALEKLVEVSNQA